MKNKLVYLLSIGSVALGTSLLNISSAAEAATLSGELQITSSAAFTNLDLLSDPGAVSNQLSILFRDTEFASGPSQNYVANGNYGSFAIDGATGSFVPFFNPGTTKEILSVVLPSLTPNVTPTQNIYVGPGGGAATISGADITPNITSFNVPFLRLTNAGQSNSPIEFFVDQITKFTDDNVPGTTGATRGFDITLIGQFRDASGTSFGSATLDGTFSVVGDPVLVDLLSGNRCDTLSDTCVPHTTATFGGTFVAEPHEVTVPEPSNLVGLVGLGLLGSFVVAKRKKEVTIS